MNIFKTVIVSTLFFSSLQINAESKFQIIDRGLDGDQRQYMVTCKDGKRASVTKYFDMPEVSSEKIKKGTPTSQTSKPPKLIKTCITTKEANEECKTFWEFESAARAACSP